ncbi:helix-turn-helix domain-containing protein [Mycolicibacterium hodleri]|uniref:AraC family transcriptional regulator n=1 Tax=Mycolicibacterium hodleri TaxID=49897 RepID=A0A502ECV1_9MYCO|nr:AraC family transcriptional regulator [Mycolicibacterium hodleri]TPG34316.1 AraC family transcriptional regulator [Mycolicibacterium hodleri]
MTPHDPVGEMPSYAGHAAFYRDRFPEAVLQTRAVGSVGAVLMWTSQGSGDWSDAATRDLKVTVARRSERGPSVFDLGAGEFRGAVRPGDWVLKAPWSATRIACEGNHTLVTLSVPYPSLLALDGQRLPDDGDFGALHTRLNNSRTVTRMISALESETNVGDTASTLYADGLILQIAALLLRESGRNGSPRKRGHLVGDGRAVREAAARLEDEITINVELAELAERAGMSAGHFAREFKRVHGAPVHQWLTLRRVQRARTLLGDLRYSVTEVAYACGFASPQHLATVFKQHTSMTPSQYRNLVSQ